jgi:hypothetical protein
MTGEESQALIAKAHAAFEKSDGQRTYVDAVAIRIYRQAKAASISLIVGATGAGSLALWIWLRIPTHGVWPVTSFLACVFGFAFWLNYFGQAKDAYKMYRWLESNAWLQTPGTLHPKDAARLAELRLREGKLTHD